MIKYIFSLLTFVVFVSITSAQQIEPQNGVYQSDNTLYAITNVKIHINSSLYTKFIQCDSKIYICYVN